MHILMYALKAFLRSRAAPSSDRLKPEKGTLKADRREEGFGWWARPPLENILVSGEYLSPIISH